MMFAAPAYWLALCFTAAPNLIVPAPRWAALPTDVSGSARGLYALHVDAAGAGDLPGAALQVRHVGTPAIRGTGALDLSVGAPLGPLSLVTGYTWGNLPNPKSSLFTLGLSTRLGPRLRLGINIQRYKPTLAWHGRTLLDVGLLWVPHRTISWSLGVDGANAPGFARGVHMRRALRLGVGLRPFDGSSLITLGADARMTWASGGHFPDLRAVVDVSPYEGIHLLGAYQRFDREHSVWAGLSVDIAGAELMGAARAAHSTRQSAADRLAFALTLQQGDARALPLDVPREVHVDVSGNLTGPGGPPWQRKDALSLLPARLARLGDAADVAQVTLHLGALDVGYAHIAELRDSVAALRARGKRVVAHLQVASTKSYLVAAAADWITLDPVGTLDVRGPSLRHTYVAQALSQLGLKVQAVARGRYKTAPEALTQMAPSPEQQEVSCGIVQELYDHLLEVLQQDRGLSAQRAHEALAQGPLGAQRALQLRLIDAIATRPQDAPGHSQNNKLKQASFAHTEWMAQEPIWGPGPKISIIALTGLMAQPSTGAEGLRQSTVDRVLHGLQQAERDPLVKGVVLRIDSPGGDVVAAEEVFRAVRALSTRKPVAVSMGDVAASGGYWAALGGSIIFAEPQTLTGSIGIYSLQLDASAAMARWGIASSLMAKGERSRTGGWQQPMSLEERDQSQQHLDELYDVFVQRVAERRYITEARARELAQGRVYTGLQARKNHLVDALGGMAQALQWVAQKAHVAGDGALQWQPQKVPLRMPGPQGLWAQSQLQEVLAPLVGDGAQSFVPLVQRLQAGHLGPQAIAFWPEIVRP